MAGTTTNPTVEQGGGPGTEGQPDAQALIPGSGPKSGMVILGWVLGFLFTLAMIWIIVRVVSGAWHIGGK